MKTEKEIKKKLEELIDYYVRCMNNSGIRFTPKNKYSTQGQIEALQFVLGSKN